MPVNFNPVQGLTNQVLNSAAGAVSNALGNLGSNAVGGLIGQLIGKLPSVGSTGGLIPPSLGISMSDPSVNSTKNGMKSQGYLTFPLDLPEEKAFFKMDIVQVFRPEVTKPPIDNKLITIGLPVPVNLAEQFQMKYNDIEIGAILGDKDVQASVQKMADSLVNPGQANTKALVSDIKGTVSKIKDAVIPLAARNIAKTLDAGLGAIVDQIKGGVPNPNLALLYQGHGFRTFNFSWKLIPRNAAESMYLRSIIDTIKHSMHPSRNGLFLDFPFLVDPQILVGGKDLFKMKRSAITSFNVNFAPSSIPAFYSQTSEPVEVDISMSLQETEIFTSSDFTPTFTKQPTQKAQK